MGHSALQGDILPKRGHPGLGQTVWEDTLPYYTRITKKSLKNNGLIAILE